MPPRDAPGLPGMLNKIDAAKRLGVSPRTIQKWIGAQMGPRHTKYMGKLYFDPKDLDRYQRDLIEVRAG